MARRSAGVKPGEFYRVEREWQSGDTVELRFPMRVVNSTWYNNSMAVERGPLVFSLKIGESWSHLRQSGPATDWEVYPTTPWNYALVVDPKDAAPSFTVTELPGGQSTLQPGGRARGDYRESAAAARMANRGRFGGAASRKPRNQ